MASSHLLPRALTLFAAACLIPRSDGHVRLDFRISPIGAVRSASLRARDAFALDVKGPHLVTTEGMLVNATIGSAEQPLEFLITTAGNESFVPVAEECDGCSSITTFIASDSTTFKVVEGDAGPENLEILKPEAKGAFTDTLAFGNVELKNFKMNMARLPLDSLEGFTAMLGLGQGSTVLQAMVDGGQIKKKAFSMWHGGTDGNCPVGQLTGPCATDGTFIFGAVDRSKYEGDLIRIDMKSQIVTQRNDIGDIELNTTFNSFIISADSISVTNTGDPVTISSELPLEIHLSLQDFVSTVPPTLAQSIWEALGANINESVARLPCDLPKRRSKLSMSLKFAGPCGPTLKLDAEDLVVFPDDDSELLDRTRLHVPVKLPDPDDETKTIDWCLASFQDEDFTDGITPPGRAKLAGSALRKTYVVLDMENLEIGIATGKDGKEDLVDFDAEGVIPGSRKAEPGCESLGEAEDGSGAEPVRFSWVLGLVLCFTVLMVC